MRDFERPDWNKNNLFNRTAYDAPEKPTSEPVVLAEKAEVPEEPPIVQLVPQTGDSSDSAITSDGDMENTTPDYSAARDANEETGHERMD